MIGPQCDTLRIKLTGIRKLGNQKAAIPNISSIIPPTSESLN